MSPEQATGQDYFDTPARSERLQLLLHLVRNVGEVIYLRAPSGAGKTVFAHKLLEVLGSDMASVWIRGGVDSDVAAVTADQLGLPAQLAARWPDAVLEALGEQDLLVVVDDADQLELPAIERLAVMHTAGGRLLLLGRGGLAQTSRDWDVQFVDLPGFDAAETTAFLRSQAGAAADRVDDDLSVALHKAARGLPGPLLKALDEVLSRARKKPVQRPRPAPVPARGGIGWQWIAGGLVVILLVGLLVFQDRVNSLFEPEIATTEPPPGDLAPGLAGPTDEAATSPATSAESAAEPLPDEAPAAAFALELAGGEPGPEETAADTEPAGGGEAPAAGPETAVPAQVATATASTEAPDEGGGAAPDPLEAVMRDALSAAEERPPAKSATARVVNEAPTPEAAPPVAARSKAASPADGERGATEKAGVGSTIEEAGPAVVEERTTAAAPKADTGASAVAGAQPAPVEERRAAPTPKVETPSPTRSAPPSEVAAVTDATRVTEGGLAWLKSRKPQHYTLQLVGARDPAGIEKYVRDHGLEQPYAIFERQLDGRPWYSLVAGDHPDRAAALAARERLPKGVTRKGVWPRTFGSIFQSL